MYNLFLCGQGTCRLWNISISVLIFLTVYNALLTVRYMYTPNCPSRQQRSSQQADALPREQQLQHPKCDEGEDEPAENYFAGLDLALGRWDNNHRYTLFDNIIVGGKYAAISEVYKTCLATQGSLEKLASVLEVADHWTGPISLATFAASGDELNSLLFYILYLRKCDLRVRDRVAFHLVLAKDRRPKTFEVDTDLLERLDCDDPVEVLRHLVRNLDRGAHKWRTKLPYPQNHVRNLARKNCQTELVFLTDVDIVPSKGMAEDLDVFFEKEHCRGQCAYVVPTYELDERVMYPPNKTELIRLAKKGLARPFHHKVFIYNQFATNFTRWESNLKESKDIYVSHTVTNFEFLYEPFYIATDKVPPHDERFIGYGYTRNSQVYEMFVAGYEFLVLSPIFTCHWGLQVKRTRPPWREHQNNLNRKQFDLFKKEIFARYNKDPLNMVAQKKT